MFNRGALTNFMWWDEPTPRDQTQKKVCTRAMSINKHYKDLFFFNIKQNTIKMNFVDVVGKHKKKIVYGESLFYSNFMTFYVLQNITFPRMVRTIEFNWIAHILLHWMYLWCSENYALCFQCRIHNTIWSCGGFMFWSSKSQFGLYCLHHCARLTILFFFLISKSNLIAKDRAMNE